MKIKLIVSMLIIFFISVMQAEATQLPKNVKQFLTSQKDVPSIRFDGLIIYNDNLMYMPVLPAYPKDVESLEIVKTYPENQTIEKYPDLILFNNNLALIKIIRTDSDTLTVRNIDWPIEVKTGAIPQDMMVPRGFVLPDSLAGILGDVQVPLIGSAKTTTFIIGKRTAPLPSGKRIQDTKQYSVPEQLKNKLFFVNNFQTEYLQIFTSNVTEPLYSLKTSGVMKDVKSALNGKYILAATNNKRNIDVIDVNDEYIVKHIDLTAIPSEITVDDINKKAYVASIKDESLTIIDLDTLSVKEKVQLVGAPQRLSLSEDGSKLAYIDMKTSNIYILDLINGYDNKLISNYPNAIKLILKDDKIYTASRTQSKLRIISYDLLQDNKITKSRKQRRKETAIKEEENRNSDMYMDDLIYEGNDDELLLAGEEFQHIKKYATSIKDINIGSKPVDIYSKDKKLYVLCAGNNSVYTYDTDSKELKTEKLPVDGFSKAFTPVPNSNLAIITNMSDLKYVVYDTTKDKAIQTLPISEYINMITILERKNGQ